KILTSPRCILVPLHIFVQNELLRSDALSHTNPIPGLMHCKLWHAKINDTHNATTAGPTEFVSSCCRKLGTPDYHNPSEKRPHSRAVTVAHTDRAVAVDDF